jgi:hypothetical protein
MNLVKYQDYSRKLYHTDLPETNEFNALTILNGNIIGEPYYLTDNKIDEFESMFGSFKNNNSTKFINILSIISDY